MITDETTVAKDLVNAATPVRDLSTKMEAVGFVEDWCKAVRAETERRLLNREEVPGFGLNWAARVRASGRTRKPSRNWCANSSGCARPMPTT